MKLLHYTIFYCNVRLDKHFQPYRHQYFVQNNLSITDFVSDLVLKETRINKNPEYLLKQASSVNIKQMVVTFPVGKFPFKAYNLCNIYT